MRLLLLIALVGALAPGPGLAADRLVTTTFTLEGRLEYEAHFRRPGETRTYRSIRRLIGNARHARLDWWTFAEGDPAGEPETFFVDRDSVFTREAPGTRWKVIFGPEADAARLQVGSCFTALLSPGNPQAGVVPIGGSLDLEKVHAHPRLGDVTDRLHVRWASDGGPDSIELTTYQRDANWTLREHRTEQGAAEEDDPRLERPVAAVSEPSSDLPLSGKPLIRALAPGVFAADMEDLDSRSLIVEFKDHLAVIEAAVGSANGERLVDAITERWPKKPIRYFLFSHYHPHYAGGLRAFIAAGAAIVTTPGNADFVRRMAARPFTLVPDRLAQHPRPLVLETFDSRFERSDAKNRIVAVDIGSHSDHTDEFVIFSMPKQRLLFETEQGWIAGTGAAPARASRRAEGFLKVLDDEHLAIETLIQSWPMRGLPATLARAELERLVAERKAAAATPPKP